MLVSVLTAPYKVSNGNLDSSSKLTWNLSRFEQTTEGEQISQLIAGYIDIILKRRQRKERFGDDGNEEEAMEEDLVTPGRAITMVGLPGASYKKVETSNLAKPGVLRNSGGNYNIKTCL